MYSLHQKIKRRHINFKYNTLVKQIRKYTGSPMHVCFKRNCLNCISCIAMCTLKPLLFSIHAPFSLYIFMLECFVQSGFTIYLPFIKKERNLAKWQVLRKWLSPFFLLQLLRNFGCFRCRYCVSFLTWQVQAMMAP